MPKLRNKILVLFILAFTNYTYSQETWFREDSLMVARFQEGNYVKSLNHAEKALNLAEKEFGKHHDNYTEAIGNIATLNEAVQNFQDAEKYYLLLKDLKEREPFKDNEKQAGMYKKLSQFYRTIAKYPLAIKYGKRALELSESKFGKDSPEYMLKLNHLAMAYAESGELKTSLPLFLEYMQYSKLNKESDLQSYADAVNNLGAIYSFLGQYDKVEPLMEETLDLRRQIVGVTHTDYAQALNNMASFYIAMGFWEKALTYQKLSCECYKIVVGPMDYDYGSSLAALAVIYNNLNQYDSALATLVQSRDICEKKLGKDHPDYAKAIEFIGTIYASKGDFGKSNQYYREGLEINRKVYGENSVRYAYSLINVGELYRKKKQYDSAEFITKKTLTLFLSNLGENHLDYTEQLLRLGNLYTEMSQYVRADSVFEKMIRLKQIELSKYSVSLSESEREMYYRKNAEFYDSYKTNMTLMQKASPKAKDLSAIQTRILNLQIATKGALLDQSKKIKARILASKDTVAIQQFWAWQKNKSKIANIQNLSLKELEVQRKVLDSIETQTNALEKQLSAKSQEFRKSTLVTNITWQDIRSKLKKNEAAIEIMRVPCIDTAFYVAFVFDGKTKDSPHTILMLNGGELEGKYFKYYKNAKSHVNDSLSYKFFWSSIAPYVKGKKKIFVCPDGVYNQINLLSLFDKESKKYLADDVDIRVVTNLKEIIESYSVSKGKYAVLMGRPKYSMTNQEYVSQTRDLARSADNDQMYDMGMQKVSFTDLPGTETEVVGIEKTLNQKSWNVKTYMEESALEEVVKSVVNPTVLHIATHGYFIATDNSKKINGMLRSGIVLAGVNTEKGINNEDGILTAYEASALNLEQTELVVLSACETGVGEIRSGEGVYGLQRGFKVAGAKAILLSLWKVDDTATQQLMNLFYSKWIATGDKSASFSYAQKEVRKSYPHPYYWGAFLLIGH